MLPSFSTAIFERRVSTKAQQKNSYINIICSCRKKQRLEMRGKIEKKWKFTVCPERFLKFGSAFCPRRNWIILYLWAATAQWSIVVCYVNESTDGVVKMKYGMNTLVSSRWFTSTPRRSMLLICTTSSVRATFQESLSIRFQWNQYWRLIKERGVDALIRSNWQWLHESEE